MTRGTLSWLLTLFLLVAGAHDVQSSSVVKRNIAELTKLAETIIVGKVVSVSDGLDGTFPYTEVTIEVSQTLKGYAGKVYTFRQFGLLKPRDMGNGMINLNVTPEGWTTYRAGEEVMLFLYKAATFTGVRTTVGLTQGAFTIEEGRIVNGVQNRGLFENLSVTPGKLTAKEQNLLQTRKGAINARTFISLVEKAVSQRLFIDK
ncbi:MAG: hypothetical protein ACE5IY_17890 [bacterium]